MPINIVYLYVERYTIRLGRTSFSATRLLGAYSTYNCRKLIRMSGYWMVKSEKSTARTPVGSR